MGIPTSVVVMHTRTTLKHLFIFSIVGCGLIKAQESGDGNDESVDFMSDDGKDDFNAGRFEDGDKGLGDYYSDYNDSDSGEKDYDDMMVAMENADDRNTDAYTDYGSGQVSYRESIEDLLQPDEDEQGETVTYVGKGSLISLLGVEDNEGHPNRGGFGEAGPNSFVPTLEFEHNILRGIRRKKKKNNKLPKGSPKKYRKGAIDGFKRNEHWSRTNKISENCDQGWSRDHQKCANSCRVNFIKNGGKAHGLKQPVKLYNKSPNYARCEACAMWSGLIKSHSWLQKSLGNLRGGAPIFCKIGVDEGCEEKENIFAACNGMSVCAAQCWSETGNLADCTACKDKYCEKPEWGDHFVLCRMFKKCQDLHPTETFTTTDERGKYKGQQECWGTAFGAKPVEMKDKHELMTDAQICKKAQSGQGAYPQWKQHFDQCASRICNLDHKDSAPAKCEKLHCKKACLENNQISVECLACDKCKACPLKSLFRTGQFDRKVNSGKPHPSTILANTYDKANPYVRNALVAMTPQRQSMLRKGSCKVCDQMQAQLDCRTACDKYEELRLSGLVGQNTPEYKIMYDICKSKKCFSYTSKACSRCIKRSEKHSKLTFMNMLGNSLWRANFDGFGCQLDCRAKTISTYAEFRGVDIFDAAHQNFTRAFDNLMFSSFDDQTIKDLNQWRREGNVNY